MAANVTARGVTNGMNIEILHRLATAANADLVAECIQVLLDCASANNCLTDRINITNRCFEALAAHEASSKCLSTCFGCSP